MSTVTVRTPAGDVPGEIIARAPFCVRVKYPGSARPEGDWFCATSGVRRGEPSVKIILETQETQQ